MGKSRGKRSKKTLPKICLNMIVRDESHIIRETLESIVKYIDYYVISDTGSVDNTKEVIKDFFDEKGIPGEIYDDPWKYFGPSRSKALEHARGKSQYVWIIDADDLVVGDLQFPDNLDKDSYLLKFGKDFTYPRKLFLRNDRGIPWRFQGWVHEYATADEIDVTEDYLKGDYYIESRRLGSRSNSNDKYKRDALILEEYLEQHPNSERDVFYCAQSWKDYGEWEKALKYYTKRSTMGKWWEEEYISLFRIAEIKTNQKKPWVEIEKAYIVCAEFNKKFNFIGNVMRAEPYIRIASYYLEEKDYEMTYKWSKLACDIPYPENASLFIYAGDYHKTRWEYLAISAYYLGKFQESANIYTNLIQSSHITEDERNQFITNRKYPEEKIADSKKKYAILWIGSKWVGSENEFNNMVISLAYTYSLIIVGEKIPDNVYDQICISYSQLDKYLEYIEPTLVVLYDDYGFIKKYKNDERLSCTTLAYMSSIHPKIHYKNGMVINNSDSSLIETIDCFICYDQDVWESVQKIWKKPAIWCDTAGQNDFTLLVIPKISEKNITDEKFDITTEIVLPEYVENLSNTKFDNKVKIDFYIESLKQSPNDIAINLLLLVGYVDQKNWDMANASIGRIRKIIDNDVKNIPKSIQHIWSQCLIQIYQANSEWQKCLDECNEYLQNDLSDNLVRRNQPWVIKARDNSIYKLSKLLEITNYDEENVKSLKLGNGNNILLTMTTCKRFDLFEKTVNSFIACCNDINRVDKWLVVDDGSSDEDKTLMKDRYPFITFLFKSDKKETINSGHVGSMNIIWEEAQNYKYLFHLEDDFEFINSFNYFDVCVRALEKHKSWGQVLLNSNYMEVGFNERIIAGGKALPFDPDDGVFLREHVYYPFKSEHYNKFIETLSGPSSTYWPHFSLRPGLWKVDMLKDVGKFSKTYHFERCYGNEYVDRGWLTGFIDTFTAIHIGKKTWEKVEDVKNAYALNNEKQFGGNNSKWNMNVLNNSSWDEWKEWKNIMTDHMQIHGYSWNVFSTKDTITNLSSHHWKIFKNNKFEYQRTIINDICTQNELWQKCMIDDQLIVLHTDSIPIDSFDIDIIDKLSRKLDSEYDIIWLSEDKHNYIANNSACGVLYDAMMNGIIDGWSNIVEYVNEKLNGRTMMNICFENRKLSDKKDLKSDDDWIFVTQLDSHGGDMKWIQINEENTIEQMKANCLKDKSILGFNTLGWIKKDIRPLHEWSHLYNAKNDDDGFWLKRSTILPE